MRAFWIISKVVVNTIISNISAATSISKDSVTTNAHLKICQ
jgi:hypothetical protein